MVFSDGTKFIRGTSKESSKGNPFKILLTTTD